MQEFECLELELFAVEAAAKCDARRGGVEWVWNLRADEIIKGVKNE